jgi:hypothetical protein
MKQDYRWQTLRLATFNLILMEFGDFGCSNGAADAERHKGTC